MYKIPIIKNKKNKVIFGERLSDGSEMMEIESSSFLESVLRAYEDDLVNSLDTEKVLGLEREFAYIIETQGKGLYFRDWVAGLVNKYADKVQPQSVESELNDKDEEKLRELHHKGFRVKKILAEKLYNEVLGVAVVEKNSEQLYLIRFPSSYLLTNKHGYRTYKEGEFYYTLYLGGDKNEKDS